MPVTRSLLNKEAAVKYIQAITYKGYKKKAAYIQYIDPNCNQKNVHTLIANMEKKPEFMEMVKVVMSDSSMELQQDVARVKGKFVKLVESNIDTMTQVLTGVKGKEMKEQATAIRLANETVTAMGAVSGNTSGGANNPTEIDPSALIG